MAFIEELGHEYKGLVMGASHQMGHRNTLLDVATNQIASRQSRNIVEEESEDEEEESEDEDEDEDE
jgi:hypothetical protein